MRKNTRFKGGLIRCPRCETYKSRSEFGNSKKHSHGVADFCFPCSRKKTRNDHYKARYGMTVEEKVEMMDAQDNQCACCGIEFGTHRTKPVVDHCHESGDVREILCDRCNVALGILGESIPLAEQLIAYIKRHR